MADSSLGVKTGTDAQVSTRTNTSGEHMQVVMLGIDGSDSVIGADTNGVDVDITRNVVATASTASLSNVNATTGSATLIASNSARKGAVVHNNSTATLFLKYGTSASGSSYTYQVPPDGTWEMPVICYTGTITGSWNAVNGVARVTELT